ncbi:MAG: ABC transporter substrate-binding protein, partial [Yaniella sp.]|nr:ABC transporter substrate-binding protein [Yaniella sp.]
MFKTLNHTQPRRLRALGFLAIGSLALSACGSSSADESSSNAADTGDMHDVNIGYFPLVHTSTIIQSEEAGYLKEAGISAELVETEGGAAAIPSLISGDIDILYSNYTSILLAAEQGLPVALLAGNDIATDDHGIFVSEDSDIDELSDLGGKSFAVNNLQNIGTVAIYSQLEEVGV